MGNKILLVDDSATARVLFKACVNDNDAYEVIEASNWQDALEKAEHEAPYLTVLDYNMPEKTGADLAKMMQDKGIKTQYVLISANTQSAVVDEVKALGFIDVLEKPITADAVQAMLEKLA